METSKLQLELGFDSITIRSSILKGVLTTKTFEGHDCYRQMLDFIQQAYMGEQSIPATITILQ